MRSIADPAESIDTAKMNNWITEKFGPHGPGCPLCARREWDTLGVGDIVRPAPGAGLHGLALATLCCRHCAFVATFSAKSIGVA